MNLTVRIPDDLAAQLTGAGGDLERRALEALAADAYRDGRLTKPDLRRFLGFTTSHEVDRFLKTHDIDDGITPEELTRQLATLDRIAR